MAKTRLAFKLWLETNEGYVFGPGVYNILKKVEKTGTLKEAAGELNMSYRYAWGLIKKAEEALGEPLIDAYKGGRSGGGGTELTVTGEQFVEEFTSFRKKLLRFSEHLVDIVSENKFIGVIQDIHYKEDVDVSIKLQGSDITLKLPINEFSYELDIGDRLELVLGCHLESIKKV